MFVIKYGMQSFIDLQTSTVQPYQYFRGDRSFLTTLYWAYVYLSMLGITSESACVIHVTTVRTRSAKTVTQSN